MAPKKSTETKVPAKDQAAKKPAASKAASKKDDATDDSDRESNVKSGLHRATKTSVKKETGEEEPAKRGPGRPRNPIAKKEAVDADAEDAAEEAAPKPAAPERGPGRPPNNTTPQTTPAKNGKSKQAPGKTGGWIYTSKEGGTVAERKVARKDENGDNVFPWVSTSTIERNASNEYRSYDHRTAYLIINGGRVAFFKQKPGKTVGDFAEEAISGVLDKQSDVFIIEANTRYRVGLQTKTAQVVEGHEVLDAATRDCWIVSEEIEWDDDVDSEHIGKVTEEVVDEGDVTVSVWAEQKTAEDEKARLKAEAEQQDITTFKHGGGEEDDSQSDENGEGPSNSKLHAGTDTDVFNGPHSNIPKKGMKSDAGKEKTRVKKTPKEEALKKEAAKTGGTRGVAVVKK